MKLLSGFKDMSFCCSMDGIEVALQRLQALCPASAKMSNMKAEINATTDVLVIRLSFHVYV